MTGAGFDDGKEAGALRTIGEVSAALGIKPHVLRYWEEQFHLLRPLKRAGGRRLYRPEDIAVIERIDRLVNREGYTLRGAGSALAQDEQPAAEEQRSSDSGARSPLNASSHGQLLARLKALRDELRQALTA